MGSKKIKIQLEDADGGKYDLALQGNISKTKIIKFIEVLDLLEIEGKDPDFENNTKFRDKDDFTSLGSKIWNLVEQKFPNTAFTSSDILELYEDEYQKPIKLGAIATYLSRYSERGKPVQKQEREGMVVQGSQKTTNGGTTAGRNLRIA